MKFPVSDADRNAANGKRLLELTPVLRAEVEAILYEAKTLPAGLSVKFVILEALRSDKRQRELYAKGRSAPGPKVTELDGLKKRSKHQAGADGLAGAADLAPAETGYKAPLWQFLLLGALAVRRGLGWGGNFSWRDYVHVETG